MCLLLSDPQPINLFAMIETLSEDDILKRMVIKSVTRVLDDSEKRVPAGHWLNFDGTRMYAKSRVLIAEALIKEFHNGEYFHHDAEELNADSRPCTDAIFIIDYRTLLSEVDPQAKRSIWRTRLCHPVIGRMPGSREKEIDLIALAISKFILHVDEGASVPDIASIGHWMRSRATQAVGRLGPPWPQVLCRRASLKKDVTHAKSRRAFGKFLDILSLIHVNEIHLDLFSSEPKTIFELLSTSPILRFDHVIRKSG